MIDPRTLLSAKDLRAEEVSEAELEKRKRSSRRQRAKSGLPGGLESLEEDAPRAKAPASSAQRRAQRAVLERKERWGCYWKSSTADPVSKVGPRMSKCCSEEIMICAIFQEGLGLLEQTCSIAKAAIAGLYTPWRLLLCPSFSCAYSLSSLFLLSLPSVSLRLQF